jgi:hypothetical protein
MREAWYVTEAGGVADPADCTTDEKGDLVAKDGSRIARRASGLHHSRNVDPDEEREAAKKRDAEAAASEKDRSYKNREMKSK